MGRASRRNFVRRKKTALGPQGQAETSLKILDVNVSDDHHPEFKSLFEFYIIIFLNKLKIVKYPPNMK